MQSHLISSIPYELQNFSYFHNTSHLIINLFFLSSHILKAPLLLLLLFLLFLLFSCSPVLKKSNSPLFLLFSCLLLNNSDSAGKLSACRMPHKAKIPPCLSTSQSTADSLLSF